MRNLEDRKPGKIKFCGIKQPEHVVLCTKLGVHYVGLNFYPESSRYISKAQAKELINVRANCSETYSQPVFVGLFVDSKLETLIDHVQTLGLTHVQLHGNESSHFIQQIKSNCAAVNVWKALKIDSSEDFDMIHTYKDCECILLDSKSTVFAGGTGKKFDWKLLKQLPVDLSPVKIALAGGISEKNIHLACEENVDILDICSGIESKPGVKDPAKMEEIMKTFNSHCG